MLRGEDVVEEKQTKCEATYSLQQLKIGPNPYIEIIFEGRPLSVEKFSIAN